MNNIVDFVKKISVSIGQDLRVAVPGKILSFDFKTQKAEVKIDIKEKLENGGEIDYPIISAVPVLFFKTGGASITAPVKADDRCLLLFADRDISNWLLGGKGRAPESRRTHALSDAIAIMGLSAFTDPAVMENNTDFLIKFDQSVIRLRPDGNIDIHSKSSVNVETQVINAKCTDANIEALGKVDVKCNNANIEAADTINTQSKYANINADLVFQVNCDNANIQASNNVNIECKNSYLQTSENVYILSKDTNIKASDTINIECTTANITTSETANITSKNLIINNAENIAVISKNINIIAQEGANISCDTAIIDVTSTLTTSAETWVHTGKSMTLNLDSLVVNANDAVTFNVDSTMFNGDIDITGDATIGGIAFSTHTHPYNEPVVGSSPTEAIPSTTGAPE